MALRRRKRHIFSSILCKTAGGASSPARVPLGSPPEPSSMPPASPARHASLRRTYRGRRHTRTRSVSYLYAPQNDPGAQGSPCACCSARGGRRVRSAGGWRHAAGPAPEPGAPLARRAPPRGDCRGRTPLRVPAACPRRASTARKRKRRWGQSQRLCECRVMYAMSTSCATPYGAAPTIPAASNIASSCSQAAPSSCCRYSYTQALCFAAVTVVTPPIRAMSTRERSLRV